MHVIAMGMGQAGDSHLPAVTDGAAAVRVARQQLEEHQGLALKGI